MLNRSLPAARKQELSLSKLAHPETKDGDFSYLAFMAESAVLYTEFLFLLRVMIVLSV